MLDIYTHPEQDLISVVKKITTKTLIIVGKKDYITSPTLGQKFRNSIKNSQIVEIANATHFAHIETPRLFYQAVKKFLAR